jgi:hypothetical protein
MVGGSCSAYGRTTYLSENLKIRDHLEGSRHRWKVNIEVDLKEIVCEDVKGIRLTVQEPLAGCCEHGIEYFDTVKGD